MATKAERDDDRRRRREAALALRQHMSPLAPAPDRFRVATWNVNSLKARSAALRRFLERARPDVVCLQETKASDVAPAAADIFDEFGYTTVHAGAGAYNGVAIASLHAISDVTASAGFDDVHLDREPRLISCLVDRGELRVRVVSVYVPHGRHVGHWHYDYKLAFLDSLAQRVGAWVREGPVVLGGDVNVAPTNSDIFHPDAFVGLTHVTEPERQALAAVLDAGLVDLDALRWGPHERRFTWWNHGLNYSRNLGMRIDLLAADRTLSERLETTWIDHIERGAERPSDHAALIADFDLSRRGARDSGTSRGTPIASRHGLNMRVVEDEVLARRVAELLRGRSIATAESCTAGRVAEVLACVEQAADFLRGGLVAYQDEVKRGLLGVTARSVLTAEAAEQMASGVARLLGADVTVSTTGVAGDEAEKGTPPGTVCIATSVDGRVTSAVHRFEGSPVQVCDRARRQALLDLIAAMDGNH